MAYTTKAGQVIPSAFDMLWLPLIAAMGDKVRDPDAVAALKARLKEVPVPQESDEFAHLRLRGTHEFLGRLIGSLGKAGACLEMLDLVGKVRDAVARVHDALPPNPEFPRAKLGRPAPGSVPSWFEEAETARPHQDEAPVRNPGSDKTDYSEWLD